jgi:N-acetylglutamate synthase-like GNAT family acetyltransferase
MPDNIFLRRLLPQDAPILQQISSDVRSRCRAIPDLSYVADTPAVTVERLKSGAGWVAENSDGILGYALTKFVDSNMFLDNISTRIEAKRSGLGSRLLSQVLQSAEEEGCAAITLTTFRSPPWNGPWFRRLSFYPTPQDEIGPQMAEIIERQSTYLNPLQRETLMRKTNGRKIRCPLSYKMTHQGMPSSKPSTANSVRNV